MCGITGGVWSSPEKSISVPTLERMTSVLAHRGPDDDGRRLGEIRREGPKGMIPGAALGFRRLSIIDLADGHQPMSNEDGKIWVVFNGEIYNFRDLRRRLEGAGHTFRTHCDTEVIVHLYEDEGADCFAHLNGMFAVAIWDERNGRLTLGRDRLGQKPLVYRHEPGRLTFASELKSLLETPDAPREIDPTALDEYLTYQYVPFPRTIFRGIRKLPPGHMAVYEDDRLSICKYWDIDLSRESHLTADEHSDRLKELLESSVALRMQSDVPLGAFLSGGVDSSLIVALMQRRAATPVKTFNMGFSVADHDESEFAWMAAKHLGTDHEHFQVTPDAVDILPKLVWQFDEPFADSSAVPTWLLSKFTRRRVTVALSGDGGDELFAGYQRYLAVRLGELIDRSGPLRAALAARLWQRLPGGGRQRSFVRRWKRFTEAAAAPPVRRYLEWIAIFNEARRGELYRDDFLESLPNYDPLTFLTSAWSQVGRRDAATRASLGDLITYLPCDLMTKVDIASMAHGLECRSPFLDYRVVELAASMPIEHKLRRGKGKRMLQQTFGPLLPSKIWRRKKMGFGVPVGDWFRSDLRNMSRDLLLDSQSKCGEFFRAEAMERLIKEHHQRAFDHGYRLWSLLVLELWLREWQPTRPFEVDDRIRQPASPL